MEAGETIEDACRREVKEETNLEIYDMRLLGVYSGPGRDPRGHVVSVAFRARADFAQLKAGDDARFTKKLWTERTSGERPQLVTVADEADQARFVVERVLENREAGATLKQQAVLFRASHHSGPLEVELTRRNIPFVKFGGPKFLDAAHVKDLLALLRFLENPRDRVAGFRLLQLLPGVGPSSAQRILEGMLAESDPLAALVDTPAPPRVGDDWRIFVDMVGHLKSGRAVWPAEIEYCRRWYEPHLDRIHEDSTTRRADLVQLEQIARGYPSRERFLTELTLDPPDATSDEAGAPHLDEAFSFSRRSIPPRAANGSQFFF